MYLLYIRLFADTHTFKTKHLLFFTWLRVTAHHRNSFVRVTFAHNAASWNANLVYPGQWYLSGA